VFGKRARRLDERRRVKTVRTLFEARCVSPRLRCVRNTALGTSEPLPCPLSRNPLAPVKRDEK